MHSRISGAGGDELPAFFLFAGKRGSAGFPIVAPSIPSAGGVQSVIGSPKKFQAIADRNAGIVTLQIESDERAAPFVFPFDKADGQ